MAFFLLRMLDSGEFQNGASHTGQITSAKHGRSAWDRIFSDDIVYCGVGRRERLGGDIFSPHFDPRCIGRLIPFHQHDVARLEHRSKGSVPVIGLFAGIDIPKEGGSGPRKDPGGTSTGGAVLVRVLAWQIELVLVMRVFDRPHAIAVVGQPPRQFA